MDYSRYLPSLLFMCQLWRWAHLLCVIQLLESGVSRSESDKAGPSRVLLFLQLASRYPQIAWGGVDSKILSSQPWAMPMLLPALPFSCLLKFPQRQSLPRLNFLPIGQGPAWLACPTTPGKPAMWLHLLLPSSGLVLKCNASGKVILPLDFLQEDC